MGLNKDSETHVVSQVPREIEVIVLIYHQLLGFLIGNVFSQWESLRIGQHINTIKTITDIGQYRNPAFK